MPDIGQIKGTNIKRGNSGLDPKIFDPNKELLDAMRIIARQEIDKAPRDITKNALVRSVNTNGTVNITIEGKEFNNIPNYTSGSISPNDTVKVTYPQNQASNMYVSGNKILNVYPVGSIYISLNQVNPAQLFGGVWEQIKDRFLISAGGSYDVNSIGGNVIHSHNYGMQIGGYYAEIILAESGDSGLLNYNTDNSYSLSGYSNVGIKTVNMNGSSASNTITVNSVIHYNYKANTSYTNSLPPYLAVYMWKRTA